MTDGECPMLSVFIAVGETAQCDRCGESCTGPQLARKRMFGCQPKAKSALGGGYARPIRKSSGIGDALEAEFGKWWIHSSPSCGCTNIRDSLNSMNADQVRALKTLPEQIIGHAQYLTGISGKLIQSAMKMPGGLYIANKAVRWCIEKAIKAAAGDSEATSEQLETAPDSPSVPTPAL